MRIYLAARFGRQEEMKEKIKELETLGHTTTCRWVTEEPAHFEGTPEEVEADRRKWAFNDLEDVSKSEVLIFFSEEGDAQRLTKGGRHVEFGIAIALGLLIMVVGGKENIFHYLPSAKHFDTWDDLIKAARFAKQATDAIAIARSEEASNAT